MPIDILVKDVTAPTEKQKMAAVGEGGQEAVKKVEEKVGISRLLSLVPWQSSADFWVYVFCI